MCGILLVKSKHQIPLDIHLGTFSRLKKRGPDLDRYQYKNNIFIGQTVLHVTGTDDYYRNDHDNFLSYNGEIYNFKQFGNYRNDIEFVDYAVNNDLAQLKHAWGPWAWAWTDGDTVLYASDPQGERCLYQYHDNDLLIVCSEVAPILDYVSAIPKAMIYKTRHWAMLDQTPWQGITKITAGQLYKDGQVAAPIDTVWDWIRPVSYGNIDEAYEEFRMIWRTTLDIMRPSCSSALTYSGGLDTSIILSHIPDLSLYTTNMIGKDPIAESIEKFLTPQQQQKLHRFDVDPEAWAKAFIEIIDRTRMPVQSWSFVGQWIISKHCNQRVLFTGAGADELFGGYDIYQKLKFDSTKSVSPYSENGDHDLWQMCMSSYHGHEGQATLLMDYWYQIAGCDIRGVDVISGAWGIETRNPFLSKPVMQLALNLPFQYKVGAVSKPLIRRLFLETWSQDHLQPKKGFTGHCNDALPWLEVDLECTYDRDLDWKQIVTKSFYKHANLSKRQTILDQTQYLGVGENNLSLR